MQVYDFILMSIYDLSRAPDLSYSFNKVILANYRLRIDILPHILGINFIPVNES